MKTLKETSVGETVKVVKLNGVRSGQKKNHGYGNHQGC